MARREEAISMGRFSPKMCIRIVSGTVDFLPIADPSCEEMCPPTLPLVEAGECQGKTRLLVGEVPYKRAVKCWPRRRTLVHKAKMAALCSARCRSWGYILSTMSAMQLCVTRCDAGNPSQRKKPKVKQPRAVEVESKRHMETGALKRSE
jgi:hypothetical protein